MSDNFSANNNVAILIPTFNRPDFLSRQLNFFEKNGSRYPVYVGDASTGKSKQIIGEICRGKDRGFKLYYENEEGSTIPNSCASLLKKVSEPFACLIGDDDFQILSGLQSAAEFLSNNLDYASARSRALLFVLKSSGPYGELSGVSLHPQLSIDHDSSLERVNSLFQAYYCSLFNVVRTPVLREAFQLGLAATDKIINAELLPSAVVLARGKCKALPGLGILRQGHDQRYMVGRLSDWLSRPSWESSKQILVDSIAKIANEVDRVSIEDARASVDKSFEDYLRLSISRSEKFKHYPLRAKLKKSFPWLHKTWVALGFGRKNESQADLIEMPEYKEFLGIYEKHIQQSSHF